MNLTDVLQSIAENTKINDYLLKLSTGIPDLDMASSILNEGNLTLVAGYRNSGKSSFICQTALESAKQENSVIVFSLEEPQKQIKYRLLSQFSLVDIRKIQAGMPTPDEYRNLTEAISNMQNLNIDVKNTLEIEEIESAFEYYDLILIENLSLLENFVEDIRAFLIKLKTLAVKHNKPVIITDIAIRKRSRADKRPQIIDILHLDYIAGITDNILLLYRTETDNLELILGGKNVMSPFVVKQFFNKYTCTIVEEKNLEEIEGLDLDDLEDLDDLKDLEIED